MNTYDYVRIENHTSFLKVCGLHLQNFTGPSTPDVAGFAIAVYQETNLFGEKNEAVNTIGGLGLFQHLS